MHQQLSKKWEGKENVFNQIRWITSKNSFKKQRIILFLKITTEPKNWMKYHQNNKQSKGITKSNQANKNRDNWTKTKQTSPSSFLLGLGMILPDLNLILF